VSAGAAGDRGGGNGSGAPVIGVIGLGEAGSAIAADLAAAGAQVRGWDPVAVPPVGVEPVRDEREAAAGADAVLVLTSAATAEGVAESIAPALEQGQLFADLNTTAPGLKRDVAKVVAGGGAVFADVALIAPVPGRGIRTPALVSGPGAERFAEIFAPLGMPVTPVGGEVGEAAARKLAQSIFTKGLAAAIGEALAAGEQLGCEEWLYGEIERTLTGADAVLLRRLVEGAACTPGAGSRKWRRRWRCSSSSGSSHGSRRPASPGCAPWARVRSPGRDPRGCVMRRFSAETGVSGGEAAAGDS
jgi:3-hydroxyisobutyrate dehydrogenase-like beta-hydroxyacid dehydrogenase